MASLGRPTKRRSWATRPPRHVVSPWVGHVRVAALEAPEVAHCLVIRLIRRGTDAGGDVWPSRDVTVPGGGQ